MPITLREQSFQVLAALMERPGEIVTREELRRRLWASDTFVDFEVALNSAVSRLRYALGDSANSPSSIETIPKRGYRFVVPIPRRPAVAVMPFVNQTGNVKDEYFSDGLTDELIRALSRVQGLRVTAGSVVFRFKGQRCDARQIGNELGVEAVLEGSVWRTGDRIGISVNLVGVKDGFNLWAQRFDSNLGDVFTIQDEVCSAVAEAMHIRSASQPTKAHPCNATAYMLYLKGAYLLKRRRPDSIQRAFEYQQEAIPAGARLGRTLLMLRMFQWRWAESEKAHRRAISWSRRTRSRTRPTPFFAASWGGTRKRFPTQPSRSSSTRWT
jgi:TolB-like protein